MVNQHVPEKRRAERVRLGALRVDFPGARGTLIDLSEGGAGVELPVAQELNSHVTFHVDCEGFPLRLHGRVVRCTPRYEGRMRVTWADPLLYDVAIEFFDLAAQSATTLRELVSRALRP